MLDSSGGNALRPFCLGSHALSLRRTTTISSCIKGLLVIAEETFYSATIIKNIQNSINHLHIILFIELHYNEVLHRLYLFGDSLVWSVLA